MRLQPGQVFFVAIQALRGRGENNSVCKRVTVVDLCEERRGFVFVSSLPATGFCFKLTSGLTETRCLNTLFFYGTDTRQQAEHEKWSDCVFGACFSLANVFFLKPIITIQKEQRERLQVTRFEKTKLFQHFIDEMETVHFDISFDKH